MSDRIRILTVDDHKMFRDGLAMVLASQPDMNLVAQASNGREAIQQFRQYHPDVTLMDLLQFQSGPSSYQPRLALYSLTESVRFPFHAEPTPGQERNRAFP